MIIIVVVVVVAIAIIITICVIRKKKKNVKYNDSSVERENSPTEIEKGSKRRYLRNDG